MNKISRAFPTLNRFARLLSFATINKQSRITSHPRNKALLGDHGEQSLHKALLCWSPKVGFWAPTLTSPGATAKRVNGCAFVAGHWYLASAYCLWRREWKFWVENY